MKLVQFGNGKYGVRRFSFSYMCYVYADFECWGFFWSKNNYNFVDCQTSSIDVALNLLNSYKKEKVIK